MRRGLLDRASDLPLWACIGVSGGPRRRPLLKLPCFGPRGRLPPELHPPLPAEAAWLVCSQVAGYDKGFESDEIEEADVDELLLKMQTCVLKVRGDL